MSGHFQRRCRCLRAACPPARRAAAAAACAGLLGAAGPAQAADPQRGAGLYATPPAVGLLACADCHGATPQVNNFGNIWAGRNAVALIERAVRSNTGGMGYFGSFYGPADFADIAAYLGNTPAALAFAATDVGRDSAPLSVVIATSTKIGVGALTLSTEGAFVVAGSSCGTEVPRFGSCVVDVLFRPTAAGPLAGSLRIGHDGTPTPVRIALSGQGTTRPAAVARLEPARLDFLAAGPEGVQSVSVLNDSAERLTLGSTSVPAPAYRRVGGSCMPGLVLQPGRRCDIALRLDAAAGAPDGRLDLAHDGAGGGSTLPLSARLDGPPPAALQADRPVVDFGTAWAGSTAPAQTVTWRNTGTADWRWQARSVSAPGVTVLADGCRSAGRLAPGQACSVVLSFAPARGGISSGQLVLQGVGVAAASLPVSGRAAAGTAAGAASPASLSFSATAGQRVQRHLRLLSLGDLPWAVDNLSLSGPDAARFAIVAGAGCAAGSGLPPGSGCTLALAFTPTRSGAHQASLRVAPADGGAVIDVPLAASVAEPAAGTVALRADASRLDFGEQAVGAAARPLRLTLSNAGPAPWSAAGIAASGDDAAAFRLAGSCASGLPVPAGAGCEVDIGFVPASAGLHQATLLVPAGDGGEPLRVSLAGRAAATGTPRLQADRAWLAFAPVRPGQVARGEVTVSNHGSAPAAPPRWTVDPPFRIERLDPACLSALPPGARCTVRLQFSPAEAGAAQGRLRFGGTAGVALRGQAVDEAMPHLSWQLAPTAPSHAAADVGAAPQVAATWTLVNTGDAATGPLAPTFTGPHAADFSLDGAGGCRSGTVLAPRQACSLRVAFHPSGAGPRRASLQVQGGVARVEQDLEGTGQAEARGRLQALPRRLTLDTAAGTAPAVLAWHNDGPAALTLSSLSVRGPGFVLARGRCPAPPFILQPGQSCVQPVAWNGGADARLGAEVLARTEDGAPLAVALAMAEDPALRSNVGGTGGGAAGAAGVLGLALAAAALRRAQCRHA